MRTTLLGVALLWGGLFLIMIQGYGDCGSTAAEQAACERMWSESGERLRSVVLVVLGMTGLAVTAIARPRGRIPAMLAIAGGAAMVATLWSAIAASIPIDASIDGSVFLPVAGSALIAIGAAHHTLRSNGPRA